MEKRTPKEWQRLVAQYERGFESRREFCGRYGLATSTMDYRRHRSRGDGCERLVGVEIEVAGFCKWLRKPPQALGANGGGDAQAAGRTTHGALVTQAWNLAKAAGVKLAMV